jgi:hypothetical protein
VRSGRLLLDSIKKQLAGDNDNQGQECVMAGVRKSVRALRADRARAGGFTGELADLIRALQTLIADPYRPELHYMRGPGPKWHAKHDPAPAIEHHDVPALARVRG